MDEIIKDKFLENEDNSRVYKSEHWKNFELQLEKHLPSDKKRSFIFNNIFIYSSIIVLIILIPFIFLQSKESTVSTVSTNKITSVIRNEKQLTRVISCSEKNKNIDKNNLPVCAAVVCNTTKSTIIPEKHEDVRKYIEQNNIQNNALQVSLSNNDKLNFETPISIKKILQIDTYNLQQNKLLCLTSKTTKEIKSKKTDSSKKTKKISRTKILAPHINYNGF